MSPAPIYNPKKHTLRYARYAETHPVPPHKGLREPCAASVSYRAFVPAGHAGRGVALSYRALAPDGESLPFGIEGNPSVTSAPTANYSPLTANSFYTFSAKERDSETGLSYFGSRYYSSDLSIWLSVDPQSDKYASLSPYVYCADNPVKLVDPNGEEIGDYFDQYGRFLGTDCIDDGKIHIINRDFWNRIKNNMSWNGNDGVRVISHDLASDQHDGMFSKKPSEANLSEDAIFNIVKHYNSTSLPLGIGDKTGSELLTTQTQEIDVTHDGITDYYKQVLQCNTKVWEKSSRLLDNYYNIINAFDHESHHINTFNEIGGAAYLEIPNPIREINAIQYQQSLPSYQRTSKAFKNGINDYYDEQIKQLK